MFLHDIAGDPPTRHARMAYAKEAGAWVVTQAGHVGSSWVRGGVYDIPGFAVDLLYVLGAARVSPVILVASGASAAVAALVAGAAPDLVAGLDVVTGEGGWSLLPHDDETVHPWLDGVHTTARDYELGTDDPILALGPVEPLRRSALELWTGAAACHWWAPPELDGHGLRPELRCDTPHWSSSLCLDRLAVC